MKTVCNKFQFYLSDQSVDWSVPHTKLSVTSDWYCNYGNIIIIRRLIIFKNTDRTLFCSVQSAHQACSSQEYLVSWYFHARGCLLLQDNSLPAEVNSPTFTLSSPSSPRHLLCRMANLVTYLPVTITHLYGLPNA